MSDKSFIWAWAIKNVVCVICWTTLAIVFGKWWIALFMLLCMSDFKATTPKYSRICDGCGEHSPYANSRSDALIKAKAAGWAHFVTGDKDYCPKCKKEME